MSSFPEAPTVRGAGLRAAALACLVAAAPAWSAPPAAAAARAAQAAASVPVYVGIGRPATPREVAAWDIDVRPDFRGLPAGSGTVAQGQNVWEAKCASCHGSFGESNEVFNPIVGGTTAKDIESGRVASLAPGGFPGRTTLMKLPTVSTLWDYIRRAMPWNAPKSLSADEVYAVTAYVLNLGGIVPDDYTLSQATMADVQRRLPNRNGMTTEHALWPGAAFGNGKPDVKAPACMRDCGPEPKVASRLPDAAQDAHGKLADQVRVLQSPVRDAKPAAAPAPAASASPPAPAADGPQALAGKHGCIACHAPAARVIGPSWQEVGAKYAGKADAATAIATSIRQGGSGRWGAIPMPPQSLPEGDVKALAGWLAAGGRP